MTTIRVLDEAPRWRVPYAAPGSLGGFLVVGATSREDAINAAIEVHRSEHRSGPRGAERSFVLPARQRAAIDYGEPEPANAAAREVVEHMRGAA